MREIDDPNFVLEVTLGIPLDKLEQRLRPSTREMMLNHSDTFHNLSAAGFIGEEENLLDVIMQDWEVVSSLGTTHAAIAGRVASIIGSNASRQLPQLTGVPLAAGYEYMPTSAVSMGYQTCPWEDEGKGMTGGYVIKEDLPKLERLFVICLAGGFLERSPGMFSRMGQIMGESDGRVEEATLVVKKGLGTDIIIATTLLPHLISQHYFFEGKQSPFRADPTALISAFGLSEAGVQLPSLG